MSGQWRGRQERGSRSALRLIIWLARHCGRPVCRVLLLPISAYFLFTAPLARRSSQAFLQRATGRAAGWLDALRHLFVYASTLLDRVYLGDGKKRLSVAVRNEAAFLDAMKHGRGCLLLGSHLGSFDMLGIVGGAEKSFVLNVVMHLDESANIRDLLARPQSTPPYQLIPLGEAGSMLRVKECLERGEVAGILADRVYGDEPTRSLPFLGEPARFSMSPLRLAKITGAPVVAMFGLFRGGNHYEIVFEPLATRVDEANQARALQSYVTLLEYHARQAPYNWFNFYDYWSA